MKICHFSSLHEVDDIRVFVKECVSLADAGHEVYLVACGTPNEKVVNGVHLIGMGDPPQNRISRMMFFSKQVFNVAKELDCEIYHFHDPELLPYGKQFKRLGKKVIFDSHEDIPAQIMDKYWIPKVLRGIVASAYKRYETSAVKNLDAVIAATPHIAEKFEGRAKQVAVINNYPRLDDIEFHNTPFEERKAIICYAGGINDLRGEKVMVEAMKDVEGVLIIAGDHEKMEIGESIKYVGRLDRKEINALYGSAIVGLCVLKPIPNYYYSQPIKMYEYMAAGIPFVCSDFPLWKEVVDASNAGLLVDPEKPKDLALKINYLLQNRNEAQIMGKRGYEYMMEHYNWANEERRLINLYQYI